MKDAAVCESKMAIEIIDKKQRTS